MSGPLEATHKTGPMKLTKKIEAEILHVMDDYWGSSTSGATCKHGRPFYRMITGISAPPQAEIWNSKKEIVDFTEKVLDHENAVEANKSKLSGALEATHSTQLNKNFNK